jgi:hypothetical protein
MTMPGVAEPCHVAKSSGRCYNLSDMADWRQIQARIRKAKNSPDPSAKLSELYQRTRDAMVAWELGAIEEKAEHKEEAGNWYTIAAQRFRRADWKKKAEEALTRLGIALPAASAEPKEATAARDDSEPREKAAHETTESESEIVDEESEEDEISGNVNGVDETTAAASTAARDTASTSEPGRKKRRRGRRGGRGRRKRGAGGASGLPSQAFAQGNAAEASTSAAPRSEPVERRSPERAERAESTVAREPKTSEQKLAPPQLPSERTAHGRAGDPALASRMAHLESRLRRLLGSPLHKLDELDDAPAGPGVFLLSESDQTTSYYVEACQTLRIGCANLARGGRSGKNTRGGQGYADSGLKSKLAEYLGINEAKVAQYMKDHCVVRWIQLDDDAQILAHFAIGVLRTPLNLE